MFARENESCVCRICNNIFLNARMLPCGHSFCGPSGRQGNGSFYSIRAQTKLLGPNFATQVATELGLSWVVQIRNMSRAGTQKNFKNQPIWGRLLK